MGAITKWSFLLFSSLFFVATINAQYPATGNKQRLGWQTTGDGLVYRGAIADTSTLDPSGLNNAWMLLDTVNGSLYAYRSKAWQLVSGGGGVSMPFDSVTFNINEGDASEQELKYSAEKGYLQYGGLDSVQIPLLPGIWYVRNDDSVTVSKGMVVRASGTLGASGRIKVKRMIADGSIPAMYVLGIAMHDIASGADGYVMTQGKIRQVNTTAYSEGAVLYADVDTLGGLTQTEPTGSNLKLPIAFVVHSASNGTLAVRVSPGTYLRDLHDAYITSPDSSASLYYNAAQGVWRDTTPAALKSDISGTTNRLAMFTGSNAVGNSPLYNVANNQFIIGHTASGTGAKNTLEIRGTGNTDFDGCKVDLYVNSSGQDYHAPIISLRRSRSATAGAFTKANDLDWLGQVIFNGADGDEYTGGALIRAIVDGTTGNNDMPASLLFATTPDGSSTQTERMRITSAGRVGIGTATPARSLHVSATDAVRIPVGTAAQRGTGAQGDVRFNSDSTVLEFYDGTGWRKPIVTNRGNGKGVANSFLKFDAAGYADTSAILIQANNRIGIFNSPAAGDSALTVTGGIRATRDMYARRYNVSTFTGQVLSINNYAPAGSLGRNVWIGNGGQASQYTSGQAGGYNVSLGAEALLKNTTGFGNIAVASQALSSNTTGAANVAIGGAALAANTTHSYNTAVGANALQSSNSSGNTAIGQYTLNAYNQTTGDSGYNTAIGTAALSSKTIGAHDVAIGNFAGRFISNTWGVLVTSSNRNVFIGAECYPNGNGQTGQIVIGYGAVGNGSNTTTIGNSSTTATYIPAGKMYIGGTTAPTATLHLPAGTASANTAPLKFTSGTNLTTPEAGAVEWNGTNLFITTSMPTRQTVNQGLTGSATIDFLSTNAQNSRDVTVTVTGASDGDVVALGVPNAVVNANTCYTAWVSATNTVTVRFNNYSSAAVDPAQGNFKIFVTKF